jgi:hypothetical protein
MSPIAYRTARPKCRATGPTPRMRHWAKVLGDRPRIAAAVRLETNCGICLGRMAAAVRWASDRGICIGGPPLKWTNVYDRPCSNVSTDRGWWSAVEAVQGRPAARAAFISRRIASGRVGRGSGCAAIHSSRARKGADSKRTCTCVPTSDFFGPRRFPGPCMSIETAYLNRGTTVVASAELWLPAARESNEPEQGCNLAPALTTPVR